MTIYALSTGPGISGIAVIRVSGKNTAEVIKKITKKKLPTPRVATLQKFNKSSWIGSSTATLSHGQRQLLCIMSVFAMDPKIIILDEVFSGLDLPTTRALDNYIKELPQMIIQITHDLSTLEESDRVIWLDHGKIFLDGSPKSVLIEYSQHAQRNMKL